MTGQDDDSSHVMYEACCVYAGAGQGRGVLKLQFSVFLYSKLDLPHVFLFLPFCK